MSDESIVALIGIVVTLLVGFICWLAHISYRLGVIYTLMCRDLKDHDRRLLALERKARPAAS